FARCDGGRAPPPPPPPPPSPAPPRQSFVRNGDAGSPSRLHRFGFVVFRQPNRTCVGFSTPLPCTTTSLPSMVASPVTHLLSSPAISNSLSALPSRDFSPTPCANDRRILSPSIFMPLYS